MEEIESHKLELQADLKLKQTKIEALKNTLKEYKRAKLTVSEYFKFVEMCILELRNNATITIAVYQDLGITINFVVTQLCSYLI